MTDPKEQQFLSVKEIRKVEKKYLGQQFPFKIINIEIVNHQSAKEHVNYENIVLIVDCPMIHRIREDCKLTNNCLSRRHITVAVRACC